MGVGGATVVEALDTILTTKRVLNASQRKRVLGVPMCAVTNARAPPSTSTNNTTLVSQLACGEAQTGLGCSRSRALLVENKDKLEMLAQNLLEYETLSAEEIQGLMDGESVEASRARIDDEKRTVEPEVAPRPEVPPAIEPEPKFPPGFAGEGA